MNSSAWVAGCWAADSWVDGSWVQSEPGEFETGNPPKAHLVRLFFTSLMRIY